MKKAIKLPHTPSREEAAALILAGYKDSPVQVVDEPEKVRIPRAFGEKESLVNDRSV